MTEAEMTRRFGRNVAGPDSDVTKASSPAFIGYLRRMIETDFASRAPRPRRA